MSAETISLVSELISAAEDVQLASFQLNEMQRTVLERILSSERDAAATIVQQLRIRVTEEHFNKHTGGEVVWEYFTGIFQRIGRYHEALLLGFELYDAMVKLQLKTGKRLHKGMPLVRIADAYGSLGYVVHEERYLMLTLCEDALSENGKVSPNTTGIYFRLVWGMGFSNDQVGRYAAEFFMASKEKPEHACFPEALLQDIDRDRKWQLRAPSLGEMSSYKVNSEYVSYLVGNLGDKSGRALEQLSEYLLMCMAGCRAQCRVTSNVSEYDVVCSMNGDYFDFRSEFGRYFVCECKDWEEKAGISVIAKFCRILDSTKARFGILFSKKGISGMNDASHAAREQQKIVQDRGLVIVVVDENDIAQLVQGENFIQILRQKYEQVRLDLGAHSDSV